jgi:hypothetical protein
METPRRSFQLSLRTLLELVAIIALILALIYQRKPATPGPGRYQVMTLDDRMVLVDTHTGQCWRQPRGASRWDEFLPPLK